MANFVKSDMMVRVPKVIVEEVIDKTMSFDLGLDAAVRAFRDIIIPYLLVAGEDDDTIKLDKKVYKLYKEVKKILKSDNDAEPIDYYRLTGKLFNILVDFLELIDSDGSPLIPMYTGNRVTAIGFGAKSDEFVDKMYAALWKTIITMSKSLGNRGAKGYVTLEEFKTILDVIKDSSFKSCAYMELTYWLDFDDTQEVMQDLKWSIKQCSQLHEAEIGKHSLPTGMYDSIVNEIDRRLRKIAEYEADINGGNIEIAGDAVLAVYFLTNDKRLKPMVDEFDKTYVDIRKKYKHDMTKDLSKIQENHAKEKETAPVSTEEKGGNLYEIFATKKQR